MKKFILVAVLVLGMASLALAAAEWQSNGTKVNKSEKLNFKSGPTVTANGTVTDVDFSTQSGNQTLTGNKTVVGSITTDGTIYTARIISDGAIYAGYATLNPCGTIGRGNIFISSAGMPCFCTAATPSVDKSIYDGSSACAY